jgi:hypothetical protein
MQIYNYSKVYNPEFMAKGIMVGRFDPFTVSHKKMAEIGSQLFDELIIMPITPVVGTHIGYDGTGLGYFIDEE